MLPEVRTQGQAPASFLHMAPSAGNEAEASSCPGVRALDAPEDVPVALLTAALSQRTRYIAQFLPNLRQPSWGSQQHTLGFPDAAFLEADLTPPFFSLNTLFFPFLS